jgi:uncharacterized protein (TIGR02117 family)
MARRRRKRKSGKVFGRILTAALAVPALYLAVALAGSLMAVNRDWTEPKSGITVYLADNGIHSDLLMPVDAQGLDWTRLLPKRDFAAVNPKDGWIAFGAGDEEVYLNTATWWDLTPRTIWSAMAGGREIIHAEYVPSPGYADRKVRLRPEEYRRLWAAVRTGFALDARGRPQRIDHSGYGSSDAFYLGAGKANMVRTCNSWLASRLRLAGVKTSIWPPFVDGLLWRYRKLDA